VKWRSSGKSHKNTYFTFGSGKRHIKSYFTFGSGKSHKKSYKVIKNHIEIIFERNKRHPVKEEDYGYAEVKNIGRGGYMTVINLKNKVKGLFLLFIIRNKRIKCE